MSRLRNDDGNANGGGVLILLLVVCAIWFVLTYWLQILLVIFAATGLFLLGVWAVNSVTAARLLAEQRRVCPVCGSWSDSVILAEWEPGAVLCPAHAARYVRIVTLEGDVLHDD